MKFIKKKIKKIKRLINRTLLRIVNRIFILCIRLKEKDVVFVSDVRDELGGNLEYLYNRIPSDTYTKIICTKPDRRAKRSIKEKIRLVYHLSTAKYILLEDLVKTTSFIKLRKGQELVQLWHGPGAFKKFGYSRDEKLGGDLKTNKIHRGYKKYTKAITSGEGIRKCYAEAFSIDIDKVQAVGFPRTDMFFDYNLIEERKRNVYEKYPFLKEKKVVLFAPTYRGAIYSSASYDFEKLDLQVIYEQLKNDDYVFIFKWHPGLYNDIQLGKVEGYDLTEYNDFYYDLSEERDINDLLLITDILVTDYSSMIFDYVFVNKPIVYFAYDLEEYKQERGLYFPFEDYVYGTVTTDCNELIHAIKKGDMCEKNREVFKEKFLNACDGHSTEKVYQWVFENKLAIQENKEIAPE